MGSKGIVVLVVGTLLLQAGAYGIVAGDTGDTGFTQSDARTANDTTTTADEPESSGFPASVYAGSPPDSSRSDSGSGVGSDATSVSNDGTTTTTTVTTTTDTITGTSADADEGAGTPANDSSSAAASANGSSPTLTPSADDTATPSGSLTTTTTSAAGGSDSGSSSVTSDSAPSDSDPSDAGSPGTDAPVSALQPGASSGDAENTAGGGSAAPSGTPPTGDGAQAGPGTAPESAGPGATGGATAGGAGGASGSGTVPVSSDAAFEVVSSSIDAPAGGDGTLTVRLENTGEDAENAVVTLQSGAGELTFGGAQSTSRFVGEWDEGDRKAIEVDVSVAPGSGDRSYPVTTTVEYDADDERIRSPPATFGVTPSDEQDFSLDGVVSSLNAGSEGTISGTITNEGPATAENAILVFASNTSDVTPRQSDVVLGDVESGESVEFTYPVRVRQGVAPGDRQVPFVVRYRNDDGDTLQSGTLDAQVTIDETADDLAVVDVDSALEPGESGTVEVTLENQGEDAADAVVTLQSLSGTVLFGQAPNTSRFVGEWDEGDRKTIEVRATAAPDAAEGEYPMRASLSYTDGDDEQAGAGPVTFGVPVAESADDFAVVSTSSTVPIGDEGTVSVTIENTGENATEATVSLSSLSPDLVVGSMGNATRFVGAWSAGEQRTVEYQVRASNDTERRSYPLQTSVAYTDVDDDRARTDARTFGVTPLREQDFSLANVSGNLSVGEEGTVTGTVTNEGPSAARNAVITLSADNANVNPLESEFVVGTLAAGESANFSFPIEVTDSAEPGARQLSFAVEYDNAEGEPRTSDTIAAQVDVPPGRDEFDITRRNASVEVGGSETIELEITNTRNSTVRNVNAKAFVDDPLSLADDEAFIPELGPGESATVTFEASAAGSATAGTYPLSMDFQYDTADGESKLSETYEVPIEVREPESSGLLSLGGGDGGLPIVPILLAIALVAIIATVIVRRRNGGDGRGSGVGGSGGNGGNGGGA